MSSAFSSDSRTLKLSSRDSISSEIWLILSLIPAIFCSSSLLTAAILGCSSLCRTWWSCSNWALTSRRAPRAWFWSAYVELHTTDTQRPIPRAALCTRSFCCCCCCCCFKLGCVALGIFQIQIQIQKTLLSVVTEHLLWRGSTCKQDRALTSRRMAQTSARTRTQRVAFAVTPILITG